MFTKTGERLLNGNYNNQSQFELLYKRFITNFNRVANERRNKRFVGWGGTIYHSQEEFFYVVNVLQTVKFRQ